MASQLVRQFCSNPQNACTENISSGPQSNCISKQTSSPIQKQEPQNKFQQPKPRRYSMDRMTSAELERNILSQRSNIKPKPPSNNICNAKNFHPKPGPSCVLQKALSSNTNEATNIINSLLGQNKNPQWCSVNQGNQRGSSASQSQTSHHDQVKQPQNKSTHNRSLSPESDTSSRACTQSSGDSGANHTCPSRTENQPQFQRQCSVKPQHLTTPPIISQQSGPQQFNTGSKPRGRIYNGQPQFNSMNVNQNETPCSRRQLSCPPIMPTDFRCNVQASRVQVDQQFCPSLNDSLNCLPPNEQMMASMNMNQSCGVQQTDCNTGDMGYARFPSRPSTLLDKHNLSGGADTAPLQTPYESEPWNNMQQNCCFMNDLENCADGDHPLPHGVDCRMGNDYNCECFSDAADDYCQNDATDDDQCGKEYETDCVTEPCNESSYMYQDYMQQNKSECQCGSQKPCSVDYTDNKVQVVIQIPQQLTNRPKDSPSISQRPMNNQNSITGTQPQISLPNNQQPVPRQQQPPCKQILHQGPASGEPQTKVDELKSQREEPKSECKEKPQCVEQQLSSSSTNRKPPTEPLKPLNPSIERQKSQCSPSKTQKTEDPTGSITETSSINQPPIVLIPQPLSDADDLSSIKTYELDNSNEIKIYYNPNTFNIKTFLESVQTSKLIYYPPPQSFEPPICSPSSSVNSKSV